MKAMFRIYYSPLETKFKLVFDMFDFDGDGLISKEDIHLVLSHVPIGVSYLYRLNNLFSITILVHQTIPHSNSASPGVRVKPRIALNPELGRKGPSQRMAVASMISKIGSKVRSRLSCT